MSRLRFGSKSTSGGNGAAALVTKKRGGFDCNDVIYFTEPPFPWGKLMSTASSRSDILSERENIIRKNRESLVGNSCEVKSSLLSKMQNQEILRTNIGYFEDEVMKGRSFRDFIEWIAKMATANIEFEKEKLFYL